VLEFSFVFLSFRGHGVISERARLVIGSYAVSDVVATAGALVAAHAIRGEAGLLAAWLGPLYPLDRYLPLLGFILPLWLLVFYASGLYGRRAARTLRTEVSRLVRAIVIAALLLFCVLFVAKLEYVSRVVIVLFLFLDGLFVEGGRAMVRGLVLESTTTRRVVIAGASEEVARTFKKVEAHREWGIEVVGLATDGSWSVPPVPNVRVLGSYEDIPRRVLEGEIVDEVVIAPASDPGVDRKRLESVFAQLEELGIVTRLVMNVLPRSVSSLSVDDLSGLPLLTFSTAPRDEVLLFVRRCADLALSAVLLVVLSPLFALLAALVKLTSRGPVLFTQVRCGLHGRPFTFLKFRSMHVGADDIKPQLAPFNEMDGPVFKMTNDPRVTPIGRWLRRTSLDELPQLWNILKGDMSFVGPRPAVLEEVRQYEPWQRRRLSMPPGLTCLWQVSGRNDLSFEEWMKLDLEYIDNWSLWLDVKIAVRTLPAVILGRGAK
jgi:exopolysaccharide biosynthesis polyprenyl glycosylphosphotransferase